MVPAFWALEFKKYVAFERSCLGDYFEDLRNWTKGKKRALLFSIPLVWRQPINRVDDCCFVCLCTLKGFNTKNKKGITYPNLPSAIRPVSRGLDMPVPNPSKKLRTLEAESSATPSESSEESEYGTCTHGTPEPFTQTELSDLFRDLNVPKDAAEILGSRLKGKKLLTPETYVTFYRNREKDLLQYFIQEESVVYCNDIPSVINMLG
jgi:hypothetical protein